MGGCSTSSSELIIIGDSFHDIWSMKALMMHSEVSMSFQTLAYIPRRRARLVGTTVHALASQSGNEYGTEKEGSPDPQPLFYRCNPGLDTISSSLTR